MRSKLIAVALITILLYMIVSNSIACGPPTTQYDLTVSSTQGGNVTTPVEGTHTYDAGEDVDLVAIADSGYHFVNWTGNVDDIADVNAATTTITMNGDYSVTANFALGAVTYALTTTSTDGGDVTAPGEGTRTYDAGDVVNLVATPDSGYQFVNWTGNVGTIANVNSASTTITMNDDYSITANFQAIPSVKHNLTITSTAGGDVTTPGEGTRTYDAGEVVNLVATPDANYHFVKWTGDVGTIANVNTASTTITMNADYTITASFGFNMTFIENVPDTNQPPTQTLATTSNPTNYCAPMAMINILSYWDVVKGHPNAVSVTAGRPATTAAEYLGYFMDTNDTGSPDRVNPAGHLGTLDPDIGLGTVDFVRWDFAHPLPINVDPNAPVLPGRKLGYDWTVTRDFGVGFNMPVGFDFYKREIDAGRPLVVSFGNWYVLSSGISVNDPETGETIDVFGWGLNPPHGSNPPNPEEEWYPAIGIGHAVTGVGYILNWDPDGPGGQFGSGNYLIVHDTWATTPENVAVFWPGPWKTSFAIAP
jgi:ribosomal protein L21E